MQARILKSPLRSQAGFSLVELMIVVAIIGILATVAVPNFSRFQVKARQSEARTNLGGLFAAEKAFHAEWNMYYTDFRDIGFTPEGRVRYHVGFGGASAPPPTPFVGSVANGAAGACFDNFKACFPAVDFTWGDPGLAAQPAVTGCSASAGPTGTGMTAAFAATAFSTAAILGSTNNDGWTINEQNAMCNATPGI